MKVLRISPRQLATLGAICLVATGLALATVQFFAPLAHLETRLADLRVAAMQAPMPPSPDLAVIAIDEATLAGFAYRSPVDRAFLAELIRMLEARGARAIGLDVILDQPTEPEKDEDLFRTLREVQIPLAVSFTSSSQVVSDDQLAFMEAFVPTHLRMEANLLTDPYDGLVRRINPGGEMAFGKRIDTPLRPAGFARKMVSLVGRSAPLEPVEIAWRARPDPDNQAFPTYSATYLPILPPELIAGRIVLIGAVLSMTDRHATPLSIVDDGDLGRMPGVFVQAHAVTQFLEDRRSPAIATWAGVLLSGMCALTGITISLLRRGIAFNLAVGGIVLAVFWAGAIVGYGYGLPMIPIFGPSLALVLALWMMDLLIGRGERKQREFIQGTFSRYVSPAVVDQLVADPGAVRVAGSKQMATFVFTDVAGFTSLSEALSPELLSEVLNAYLDGACEIILKYEGTIDKFIGDAIMAIFNAPLSQPDHAARAVRCVLELDRYAEAFRVRSNADGVPIGVTRIGLHTGLSIIGNFGSQARMDFTALGDTVNTAARTEGVNKYFGTRICCTEDVVKACPDLAFRPIGDIVLKGKMQGTILYTPLPDDADPGLVAGYRDAYDLLSQGDLRAEEAFSDLARRFPHDPVIDFHVQRISQGILSVRVVMDDK